MASTRASRKLYHVVSYLFERMAQAAERGDIIEIKSIVSAGVIVSRLREEALDA